MTTALVRYNANGSLDGTFGSGGSVVTRGVGQGRCARTGGGRQRLALDRQGIGSNRSRASTPSGNPEPVALTGASAPIQLSLQRDIPADGKIVLGGVAPDFAGTA